MSLLADVLITQSCSSGVSVTCLSMRAHFHFILSCTPHHLGEETEKTGSGKLLICLVILALIFSLRHPLGIMLGVNWMCEQP